MSVFQAVQKKQDKVADKSSQKYGLHIIKNQSISNKQSSNNNNHHSQSVINQLSNLNQNISNNGIQQQQPPSSFHPGVHFNFANIQTKFKVSQPGDIYEQEADRAAEEVMRMSSSLEANLPILDNNDKKLHRKCESCQDEEEEKIKIRRKMSSSEKSHLEASENVAQDIDDTLQQEGSPLDRSTKEFMESRFGFDFSKVKIHNDEKSAESAQRINALAYTLGEDIFFGPGQYTPHLREGKKLLAHELAHVIQQRDADLPHLIQRVPVAAAVKPIEVIAALLSAAEVSASLYSGGAGGLHYTSDQAQRLSEKTQQLAFSYKATCLEIHAIHPALPNLHAVFNIIWEGNYFGEIGAARVRVDYSKTTDFSRSELNVTFRTLTHLIERSPDKRTWEIQWDYEGSFDPIFAGNYAFQGRFAIDAFGNFRSLEHTVRDYSFGWGGKPGYKIIRPGINTIYRIPPVPTNTGPNPYLTVTPIEPE
jgi:hypothetical protein